MDSSQFEKRKIWDPITRLWHWLLAIVVCAGWGLGEYMDFATVKWHFYLGYTVLGLIGFRLLWGFLGPAPVRLSQLFRSSGAIGAYARNLGSRKPSGTPGHNPLGSFSVILILLVLAAQAGTGLFIESEDFFEYAPLYEYVSDSTRSMLSAWHHRLAKVVLILVILHVAAILFYLVWKRENLIKPMFSGWKWVRKDNS